MDAIETDPTRPCDRCGFHAEEWSERDLDRYLRDAPELIELARRGAPDHLRALDGVDDVDDLDDLDDLDDVDHDRSDDASPAVRLHRLWHQLHEVAAARHRGGDVVGPLHGELVAVHSSGGGVPKTAVDRATIDRGGVVGDVQDNRKHHGSPAQALSLWSTDVIDALRAEGHPIAPGLAGENLTVSGIDWGALRRGLVVEVGDVVARLTEPATPCKKLAAWFVDGDSSRIDDDRHPGWSRWYAAVERPGSVEPGAPVTIRSDA